MVTRAPPRASTSAAISPAGPAPMTAIWSRVEDMGRAWTIDEVVMPGLDPGIHALPVPRRGRRGWPGQAPAMTERGRAGLTLQLYARPRRGLRHIFLGLLERAFQRF